MYYIRVQHHYSEINVINGINMSPSSLTPGLEIRVEHHPLKLILEKVAKGEIAIPIFQRDFVWGPEDVRTLFESILSNFPIGVIILWRPPGDINIPYIYFTDDIRKVTAKREPEYLVLDGNQRLTAILLAYRGWKIIRGGREIVTDPICLVPGGLSKVELRICHNSEIGVRLDKAIKAFIEYDFKLAEEIMKRVNEPLKNIIRDLMIKLVEYRIPVYYYETTTIAGNIELPALIAESFIRINKSGRRIGNVELLASLAIAVLNGDIGAKIRETYSELSRIGVDYSLFYRTLIKVFGFKQTDVARVPLKKIRPLVDKLKTLSRDEVESRLERLKSAIKSVYEAFNTLLSVSSLDELPSQISLVPVAYYMYKFEIDKQKLSHDEAQKVLGLYVLMNFRGTLSGSGSDSRLEKILAQIDDSGVIGVYKKAKDIGRLEKITGKDLIEPIKARYLEHKAFLFRVLLTLNKADDWTGNLINFAHKDLEIHHIFPKNIYGEKADCLANLTFVHKKVNRELGAKDPLSYITNIRQETLERHFMPIDITKYKNIEEFVKERAMLIVEHGKELLPEIFGARG